MHPPFINIEQKQPRETLHGITHSKNRERERGLELLSSPYPILLVRNSGECIFLGDIFRYQFPCKALVTWPAVLRWMKKHSVIYYKKLGATHFATAPQNVSISAPNDKTLTFSIFSPVNDRYTSN